MSKLKIGTAVALSLTLVLVLQGCGKSASNLVAEKIIEKQLGGNVDINNDGTGTYNTKEGTVSTENKVPENWPSDAPVYPGARVGVSALANTDDKGSALFLFSSDSVESIVSYYKEELKNQGWEITTTSETPFGNILAGEKSNREISIIVTKSDEANQIMVSIANK